ncbi:tetratricopeptide repeat protein [Nisaea nitritireducens]|uniref:tetratricopeptide repeat protein n=1 Tax=Nisaea nitritireducens TaxID=568392 RepID=UPI001865AECD|nr:tetratricopeptide repeat protein [Nisaea nitritireducens]
MRRGGLSLAGIVLAGSAFLVTILPAAAAEIDHQQEYQACMALTQERPQEAYSSGLAWYKLGGGIPARHCLAVALLQLHQYDEAASRLERLATDLGTARTALLGGILMQAGQAWYLAGRPDRAFKLQSRLLDLAPSDPELWVDRAVTLMELEKYDAALADLDEAIRWNPQLVEAHIYRAVTLRQLDRLEDAAREVETVLELAPFNPDALLERGILRQYQGDLDGAREDWLQVIRLAPDSRSAAAARGRIEEMDVIVR